LRAFVSSVAALHDELGADRASEPTQLFRTSSCEAVTVTGRGGFAQVLT
jgi:hypothetical protein